MVLVILTALLAVCSAAKLDQTYLPPITAKTAGGSPGALEVPLVGAGPSGSYTNDVQGVVVDAVNPGTRTSGDEPTGLGGPRASYGSINSKVGEAAFHSDVESSGPGIATRIAPGFDDVTVPGGSQADVTRAHTLKFANDVGLDNYSYQYETDNGISVGENGVAADGVQAQGGYSYKGNDGKTYSVSYTADEGGYRPQGQHLPTPPPIPVEILESLEKNAKEEAAGLVDDGSYDAQKYNEESDYSSNSAGNNNDKPTIGGGDATASGSFVTSNDAQRPTSGVLIGSYKPTATSQTVQENTQQFAQISANEQSSSNLIKEHRESQGSGVFASSGEQGYASSQFGSGSQFGAKPQGSTSYTHSTQTKFGVQGSNFDEAGSSKPQAHTHASTSSGPVFTPTIHSAPKGSSAYSSAVTSGSGSASAFASSGPTDYDYKNYYNTINLGSAGQLNQGSKLSSVDTTAPSTASAFASASKTPSTFSTQYPQNSDVKPPKADFTSSASASGIQTSQSGQNANGFPSRFGENESGNVVTSSLYVPSVNLIESIGKPSSSAASAFSSSNTGVSSQKTDFQSQYSTVQPTQPSLGIASITGSKPNEPVKTNSIFDYQTSNQAVNSFTPTGPTDATFSASSTQKPVLSVGQQGFDNSYTYEKPSKPFVTISAIPSSSSSSQVSNNRQPNFPISSLTPQGSKYVNTPSSSPIGQYQGSTSSSYNGVTQAAISSFPSSLSSSSQLGSKPSSSLFGQTSVPSQDTSTTLGQQSQQTSQNPGASFGQKPIVQSQSQFGQQLSSGQNLVSQVSNQQYQGTVYEYNKPAQTLPAPENKGISYSFAQATSGQTVSQAKPSQVSTDSRFGSPQESVQSKPFGSSISQVSTFQQTQTTQGSQTNNLFAKKPSVTLSSTSQTSQLGQTPFISSQKTGSNYEQTQIGFSGSQFGQKPQISQTSQNKQTQFGSTFNAKPESTQTTSSVSSVGTQSQSLGQKPFSSSQTTGSNLQQTQFSSTGSQLGQKLQSIQSTGLTSTSSQTSFVQKPTVTTQTNSYYQQGQTTSSKSGNTPLSTQGSGSTVTSSQATFGQKPLGTSQTGSSYQQTQLGQKPQTSQGTSFVSTIGSKDQTVQTSQFGQKPYGTSFQQNQFGSSASSQSTAGVAPQSQFGQISQFVQKPFGASQTGSNYQQTQFGSTTSQSGKKPQTTQGASYVSTTDLKEQTIQTPQFGQKPFGSSQTAGSSFQQNQFGSSASSQSTSGVTPQSQFGQVSQFNQKPFGSSQTGSTYQQTQFGTTKPQFNQKPQTPQGTSFVSTTGSKDQTVQTLQFGQKPFGSSQIPGIVSQENRFGSTTSSQSTSGVAPQSQFGQKPIGSSQTTGSSFQQTQSGSSNSQLGQKPQSTQGAGLTSTSSQTLFGQKPTVTTQTTSYYQQGQSTSSKLGNTPLSTQGAGSTVTSSQTAFSQKPFGTSQTGSSYQQSQFGQKPQTSQGASYVSTIGSKDQTVQTSQFGQKPYGSSQTAGSSFQQNQFGSSASSQSTSGVAPQSQFGQISQLGLKPFGASQTGSNYQQTQFGSTTSQFGQKPQTTQGTSFVSTTGSKDQTSLTTQFGQKPFGSSQTAGSVIQQNRFGSSASSQSTSGVAPQIQFGQVSQLGQKPIGSTQISQFGQKPQTTQGASSVSTTGSKDQTVQTTQFGQKPFGFSQITGSSYQQNQLSSSSNHQSTSGVAPQSIVGQTSQSGQKPFDSSQSGYYYQQSKFGSTGSQLGQKPQTTQGSTQKPLSGTQFGSTESQVGYKPQTQGSSYTTTTGSTGQFGQITQFGQKPVESTGSSLQKIQSTSKFDQQSQQNVPTFTTVSQTVSEPALSGQKPIVGSQTSGSNYQLGTFGSQFAQKPASTTFGSYNQASQFGTQVKPSGTTETTSGQSQASAFASSSGSKVDQFVSQTQKPFGVSIVKTDSQQSQYTPNFATPSRLGESTQSNVGNGLPASQAFAVQPQKPLGSALLQSFNQNHAAIKPVSSSQSTQTNLQAASPSSQYSQGSFGSTQPGYNYQKPDPVFNLVSSQSGGQLSSQNQKTNPADGRYTIQVSNLEQEFSIPPVESFSNQGSYQQNIITSNRFSSQPARPQFSTASITQGPATSNTQYAVETNRPSSNQYNSFGSQNSVVSTSQFQPTQNIVVTTPKPSQSIQTLNPTSFASAQASSFPSRLGYNVNVAEVPIVSTAQSSVISSQGTKVIGGQGEQFGGPRDPPKFDDKTGYVY